MDSLHLSRVSTRGGYSAEQLEAIKVFGKKDLSFGCWIQYGDAILQYSHEGASCHIFVNGEETGAVEKGKEEYIKILGHIPHLEDLFRVAEEKEKGFVLNDESLFIFGEEIPYNPTIPLLDQPNLSDILNLFK